MTLEQAVESALIILPTLIFVLLLIKCRNTHGQWLAEKTGGIILYHAFEGVTALLLLISVASDPDLVVKIGEFRGMLAVLAVRAVWVAFRTIITEMK